MAHIDEPSSTNDAPPACGWEHFAHDADIGVRGLGPTPEAAFEQGALALMQVITEVDEVRPAQQVELRCEAGTLALLFVEWLNALVFEIATTRRLFGRFAVKIDGNRLVGRAWGEPIDVDRHELIVEVKGATYTELDVSSGPDGRWLAQCVVDV